MSNATKLVAAAVLMAMGACTTVIRPGGIDSSTGQATANPRPNSPEFFRQTVGDRVLFAVDQSSLSPEAQTILEGQAEWLIDNGAYAAVIEGHADERGTREYNLALGARRANAVREFLVERGIAHSRLEIVSFGKERPMEVCSEEACYRLNRRAVTIVAASATG